MEQVSIDEAIGIIEARSINLNTPLLVALDGRSGTGKTTIAQKVVNQVYACSILQDDFYTGGSLAEWSQRSPQVKADLAIDWKRVRSDALTPLLEGRAASWRTFNWQTLEGLSDTVISCEPKSIIILDGAYSARPELSDLIDLSILIELDDAVRRQRLTQREGEEYVKEWHPVWDEAEDYYFTHVRPPDAFDLVIHQS